MSIRKGRILSIAAMMACIVVLAGAGLGTVVWLQVWHGDYTEAAEQSGAATDPVLSGMVEGLGNRAGVMTVVIGVLTALALAFSIRELLRARRHAGRKLQELAHTLATVASELSAFAGQVAASAAQASAATTETTTTVEEVRQTAVLAQDKSAEAAELTDDVLKSYKVAEGAARTNTETFNQTHSAIDVIAEAISRLSEEAEAVGDIMARVNDLAEQSHLLSVNASIEAAKAGGAGKGFGVVAQEVKDLASQSKEAVSRVRVVLGDIRKAVGVVDDAVKQGREVTEEGTEQLRRSVAGIERRASTAGKAAEAVAQISVTSYQQLAGMEQIEQAILSIDESGKQSVSASKHVEEEAQRLKVLALEMRRMVAGGVPQPEAGSA